MSFARRTAAASGATKSCTAPDAANIPSKSIHLTPSRMNKNGIISIKMISEAWPKAISKAGLEKPTVAR